MIDMVSEPVIEVPLLVLAWIDQEGAHMNPRYRFDSWAVSSFLPCLFVVCLASSVWAQSTSTGSVLGQVTDRQTAVVVGAEVVLRDTSTNAARSTQTNEVG